MIKEVTDYVAVCDSCGKVNDDGEFCSWDTDAGAWDAAEDVGWFCPSKQIGTRTDEQGRTVTIVEPRIMLCPRCQKCEVCGDPGEELNGHVFDDESDDQTVPEDPDRWGDERRAGIE